MPPADSNGQQSTPEEKAMLKEQLTETLKHFHRDLNRALNNFYVHMAIHEAYSPPAGAEGNPRPFFWDITRAACLNETFISLGCIFAASSAYCGVPQTKCALKRMLEFAQTNLSIFPSSNYTDAKQCIRKLLCEYDSHIKIRENSRKIRDRVIAHTDETVEAEIQKIFAEHPIGDWLKLLSWLGDVHNRLSRLLNPCLGQLRTSPMRMLKDIPTDQKLLPLHENIAVQGLLIAEASQRDDVVSTFKHTM